MYLTRFNPRHLLHCYHSIPTHHQDILALEISDEDKEEKVMILKKSYTGHMRFIGEIYMKDLVKASIMQYCIDQLLESTEEQVCW